MQMPFTLRLAYHSFRAFVSAGLMVVCAWLLFIPANTSEQRALGVEPGTQYPQGLRPMRTAQIIITVAPPQAYTVIARIMGPDTSPLLVQIALMQMASGRVLPTGAVTVPRADSARDIDGPRFIQVD